MLFFFALRNALSLFKIHFNFYDFSFFFLFFWHVAASYLSGTPSETAVIKATRQDDFPPKEKHVRGEFWLFFKTKKKFKKKKKKKQLKFVL